jgi:hypothetical protein
MLPDLPTLKTDIQRFLDRYLHAQVNSRLGVFNRSPKLIIHEGNRMRTVRGDGSVDESELKQASAELSLNFDEIPRMRPQERAAKLDDIADQIARQMSEHMFGTLNEILEEAGQVVDHKGKPLDAEAIFSVLETLQIEFDRTGSQMELSIVVPPALAPKAKLVFEQIQSDKMLRERYEEIMSRKRMEWRDREAARKLVG